MKTNRLLVCLLTLSVAVIAGCSAGKNALTSTRDAFYIKTEVAPVTNAVPVFAAQDVVEPAKTNFQTGVITAPVPKPGAQPQGTVQVIVQPPPAWENATTQDSAKAVGSAIPVYGGLVTFGLISIFGLGKLWLNRKRLPVIATTFKTVEDAMNSAAASGDPKLVAFADKLKSNLEAAHQYAGVAEEAAKLVDAYTGHSGAAIELLQAAKPVPAPAN